MSGGTSGKAALVIAGPALAAFVPIAVVPALPAMAEAFNFHGGTDGALIAQFVMSAPSVMILLGAPLGAFATERFGRRNCLLTALLAFSLFGAAGAVVSNLFALIATRLVLGLASGVTMGLSITFAGDFFEGEQRERVLGYAAAGSSVSSVILLALGGWLVEWGGWHAPFYFYLVGLVAFAIAWGTVRGAAGSEVKERAAPAERSLVSLFLQLWPAYLLVVFLSAGVFMLTVQGPFLLETNGISSAGTRGMILSFYSLTAFAASMTYGFLRRRLGIRQILVFTALTMGIGIAAASVARTIAAFLLVDFTVGIGAGLTDPAINSVVLSRAPEAARARASGFAISAFFVGQFLTPLLTDPMRRTFGIDVAFVSLGGLLIVIAGVVLNATYFSTPPATGWTAQETGSR